jgi:hypothetical protein
VFHGDGIFSVNKKISAADKFLGRSVVPKKEVVYVVNVSRAAADILSII